MAVVDRIKSAFVAGLTLVAPLIVTVFAFQLLFGWLRGITDPIIEGTRLAEYAGGIPYLADILALCILVLGVAALGYLAQRSLGAYVFGLIDRALARVPVFSVIYTGVRQVADALTSQQSRYERVAMVEYPRKGLHSLGFVTSQSPETVEAETGEDTYNVYLPGSPNPTQGRFVLVPQSQLTELDMSVSQGIRLLVTTGIAEDRQDMAALQEEVRPKVPTVLEGVLKAPDDGDDERSDGDRLPEDHRSGR